MPQTLLQYYLIYFGVTTFNMDFVQFFFSHLGQEKMVEFLLSNGANVDLPNSEKKTPLYYAAWAGKRK